MQHHLPGEAGQHVCCFAFREERSSRNAKQQTCCPASPGRWCCMYLHRAGLLLLLVLVSRLPAGGPLAVPLPKQGAAPLLHVRLSGPPDVRVTFYQGQAPPREYATPVVVGLRPGYIYRLKVTGFVDRPGLDFFPTLEVRGTIRLGPDTPGSRHPCPVSLSPLDAEDVL